MASCPRCGTVGQAPSTRARPALPDPGPFPDAPIYPGWQMRKLLRLGLTRFHQQTSGTGAALTGRNKSRLNSQMHRCI